MYYKFVTNSLLWDIGCNQHPHVDMRINAEVRKKNLTSLFISFRVVSESLTQLIIYTEDRCGQH